MHKQINNTEIIVKDRKGKTKKVILEETEYLFEYYLWNMIKEYAGIYDIGVKWDKKWSDIKSYYALQDYCPSIRSMTQKRFMEVGKATPDVIRRQVWKDINTFIPHPEYKMWCHPNNDPKDPENQHPVLLSSTQDKPKFLTSTEKCLINRKEGLMKRLHRLAPTFVLPEWIKVGVIVKWSERWNGKYAGRVTRISDTNFQIKLFDDKIISRVDAGYAGITITHQWTENDSGTIITISSKVSRFGQSEGDTWEDWIPFN